MFAVKEMDTTYCVISWNVCSKNGLFQVFMWFIPQQFNILKNGLFDTIYQYISDWSFHSTLSQRSSVLLLTQLLAWEKQRLFRVDGISTDNHNFQISRNFGAPPLREKCSNTEFFLVCIFPHSDWIRRDISPYSVQMRENTDQKKLHIWSVFTQCMYLAHKI